MIVNRLSNLALIGLISWGGNKICAAEPFHRIVEAGEIPPGRELGVHVVAPHQQVPAHWMPLTVVVPTAEGGSMRARKIAENAIKATRQGLRLVGVRAIAIPSSMMLIWLTGLKTSCWAAAGSGAFGFLYTGFFMNQLYSQTRGRVNEAFTMPDGIGLPAFLMSGVCRGILPDWTRKICYAVPKPLRIAGEQLSGKQIQDWSEPWRRIGMVAEAAVSDGLMAAIVGGAFGCVVGLLVGSVEYLSAAQHGVACEGWQLFFESTQPD